MSSVLLGDLDGDGVASSASGSPDFAMLQACFGTSKGEANFNQKCDFNNDGIVNTLDISIFGNTSGSMVGMFSLTPLAGDVGKNTFYCF